MDVKLNAGLKGPLLEGLPNYFKLERLLFDSKNSTYYALVTQMGIHTNLVGDGPRMYVGKKDKLEAILGIHVDVKRDGGTKEISYETNRGFVEITVPMDGNSAFLDTEGIQKSLKIIV